MASQKSNRQAESGQSQQLQPISEMRTTISLPTVDPWPQELHEPVAASHLDPSEPLLSNDDSSLNSAGEEAQKELTEFHLFPKLPPEIRLLIWEQATKYKRQIVVRAPYQNLIGWHHWHNWFTRVYKDALLRSIEHDPLVLGHLVWTSPTPPPTLLSVSHEARQVALKAWDLSFGFRGLPGRIWINFDQDDIILTSKQCPRPDDDSGLNHHSWMTLDGPRDYRDPNGQHVKPECVLAEVWQDTPALERVQRIIMLNCPTMIDLGVRFRRNTKILKSLKSVVSIYTGGALDSWWQRIKRRILQALFKEEPLLVQENHIFATQLVGWEKNNRVKVSLAQLSHKDDPWGLSMAVNPDLRPLETETLKFVTVWTGYHRLCRQLSRWEYKSPWQSYPAFY